MKKIIGPYFEWNGIGLIYQFFNEKSQWTWFTKRKRRRMKETKIQGAL